MTSSPFLTPTAVVEITNQSVIESVCGDCAPRVQGADWDTVDGVVRVLMVEHSATCPAFLRAIAGNEAPGGVRMSRSSALGEEIAVWESIAE